MDSPNQDDGIGYGLRDSEPYKRDYGIRKILAAGILGIVENSNNQPKFMFQYGTFRYKLHGLEIFIVYLKSPIGIAKF